LEKNEVEALQSNESWWFLLSTASNISSAADNRPDKFPVPNH
jgi:hypothetical protein